MTIALRYLFAAMILAMASGVVLTGGLVERRMAEAERELATLNLNRSARLLQNVEDRLWWTERLPWLFRETRDEVEARQALVRYWRGEYDALVSDYPDVGRLDIRENHSLQLILASAHVRAGEVNADGDRAMVLNELDRAISVHLQVLQNTRGDRDAAFNYEFLVRLRDEIAAGADVPRPRPNTPLGRPGDADEEMDMDDINEMKVYVPSDMLDRESAEDPTLGTDAPLRRRG
jgi:hypothetical protein